MKKLLSLFLSVCCTLPLAACSGETAETTPSSATSAPPQPPITEPAPLTDKERMLAVGKGGYIYNGLGEEVVLKGINLGGWLLQETWMCAVKGAECNLDSIHLLESRGFTEEQIRTLYLSYADNYITEWDIKNIASMRMNCIRLPFWYRNFMDDDLNFYTDDPDENPGFQLTDRLIGWAEKYDLYVILDMHGCPGGQSTNHCCGTLNQNELYTVEANQEAMERLWVAIAERYKDSGTVAAYDIMNEPMNNDTAQENGWAAGSDTALRYTHAVYDRMYKAIRKVDPTHMISVEGIWSGDCLPDPAKYGWENMLYQMHLYDSTTDMIDYRVGELVALRDKYGVAIYVGEFNNGDELYTYALDLYANHKISRTAWTYKIPYDYWGNWSIYRANLSPADLANDSYEEILDKWGKGLQTKSVGWTTNVTLKNWLRSNYR